MAADPTPYLAVTIPKTVKLYFETLFKPAIRNATVTADLKFHRKAADAEDDDSIGTEIKTAEFLHTLSQTRDLFKQKLHEYNDDELKRSYTTRVFPFLRKITRWYKASQHLTLKLVGKDRARDFIESRVSFFRPLLTQLPKQECKVKIQRTTKTCEDDLTDSVVDKAFRDIKKTLRMPLKQAVHSRVTVSLRLFEEFYAVFGI